MEQSEKTLAGQLEAFEARVVSKLEALEKHRVKQLEGNKNKANISTTGASRPGWQTRREQRPRFVDISRSCDYNDSLTKGIPGPGALEYVAGLIANVP